MKINKFHSPAQYIKCQNAYYSMDISPSRLSGSVLSIEDLLQRLYRYPQNSEQANCDFAHVHNTVLHFDAKRVKYILNRLQLHFSNMWYLTQPHTVSCVIFDISALKVG